VASPAIPQPSVDLAPVAEASQQPLVPANDPAPARDIPDASFNPSQTNSGAKLPVPTSAIPALIIGLLVAVLLIALAGYAFF
jgi:hypothetical protein